MLRTGSITLAVAAFLALSEAFGLAALPMPARFGYWLFLLAAGQGASLLVRRSLDRMAAKPGRVVMAGVVECLLLAVPMTAVVWATTALALHQPLRPIRALGFYVPVAAVTGLMVSLSLLAQRRPLETHAWADATPGAGASQAASPPLPARILDRLPARLRGGELHALQAEDHYVRFHTSRGSDLVLMRFSDALAELDGIEGAQVHRSWWVAKAAVTGFTRGSGRIALKLEDGTETPVSRTYADALRAAGWFEHQR